MKKFYALALAALAFVGASAFESAQLVRPAKATRVAHNLEQVAVKAPAVNHAKKVAAAAPDKAETASELEGVYFQTGRRLNGKNLVNVSLGLSTVTADGDKVTFDGFYFSDTPFWGIFDAETQTVTIPVDEVVTVVDEDEDGNPVELSLSVYEVVWPEDDDDDFGKAPIVLNYSKEDGSIYYCKVDDEGYYETCFVVAQAGEPAGHSVYAQVYELNFDTFDAIMSTVAMDDNGDFEEPDYFPITVNQEGANLAITNFCGWGNNNTVNLTLDVENLTATAQDQQITLRVNTGTGVIDAVCDVMSLDEFTGEFLDNTVVFEAEVSDEGVILSTAYLGWCIVTPEQYAGGGNVEWMPTIQLFYNPFEKLDGVEAIAVSDANAPVEYFNLQGVRVANPENGLYIRRQGNTATKVLVK